ncbi:MULTISPECIES: hypothetical protein [Gordonia]|uniref:Mce protein n=1 Tax=Gordonia amicalis TaxID=89053 RepID=A0AAE4U4M0_9ACTN|nr:MULTISPECIES: hypothetical protein [Gordonia]KAF0968072.1 hypothetical protein BPODLACK_03531 [Gordonia sp. YY1]MBA5845734.1 hypothetical protein [Gordonia amicalis]MCZ0914827.1 hypothetical protein [Gordonia amicalis]MCZ4578636.1 hypothetical protein [Gordonia amicalis]MDV6311475.1 hypothetical protein [Gordonia amicalis]
MSAATTNKTTGTTTPKGKDVVKKSPVRGGRSRRSHNESVVDEVSSDATTETTEIEVGDADVVDSPAAPEQETSARRRPVIRAGRLAGLLRPRRVVAVLAILALLAGGGYAGWKLYENHAVDQAEQQAVATAKDYAVTLTSIDSGSIDQNFTEVLGGATGEFKDMYSRSSSQLKQMLVDNKATSKGVVIDAGVKSATTDRVVVMLFVDQSITNTASPEPRVDRSRVLMTMEKVDGRWLASKVDLP